jgi:hypothetical protein
LSRIISMAVVEHIVLSHGIGDSDYDVHNHEKY